MGRFGPAGSASFAVPVLVAVCLGLSACVNTTANVDPLVVDGRDGTARVAYPALMRIGMAARAGGDYANAVSVFRRAAEVAQRQAVPLVAAGDTLRQMGQANEAIVAYKGALARQQNYPLALEGLAKAYLGTGRPELAIDPLKIAHRDEPTNPSILLLLGVTSDFTGQHAQAQGYYREGLKLKPNDPALSLDLALSLALSGDYDQAVSILAPLADSPIASPRDRQTLALIYGLKGDRQDAARLARMDLNPAAVQHNLAFYETLRRLSPEARSRAVLSADGGSQAAWRS